MLPLVRTLADLGHEVHFLCAEDMKDNIERQGATFHCVQAELTELQNQSPSGPTSTPVEELDARKQQDPGESSLLSYLKTSNVILEQSLPGVLRFLQRLRPDAVVFDPLLFNRSSHFAARLLGLPAVAVLTLAGCGAWAKMLPKMFTPLTHAEANQVVEAFPAHAAATQRLNESRGLCLAAGLPEPPGFMDSLAGDLVLVTTSEDLQDPVSTEIANAYTASGTKFTFVGPLFSEAVTIRQGPDDLNSPLGVVRQARRDGRKVVLFSMGTVVTSNHAFEGWSARSCPRSLTGRELCQTAMAGAIDAFGAREDLLLVLVSGKQPDALENLEIPEGVVCTPEVPQVEILREGVSLFLTHGGQNSFTEAMAHGTPVVVCPLRGSTYERGQGRDLARGSEGRSPRRGGWRGEGSSHGVPSNGSRGSLCSGVRRRLQSRSGSLCRAPGVNGRCAARRGAYPQSGTAAAA
jgi:hypothetical protein